MRLLSQDAFDDMISGAPYGNNDDQLADQVIIQEPNGTGIWHRYFYGSDEVWRDVLLPGFPPTSIYLRPGQAYFYYRASGQGSMTTRF